MRVIWQDIANNKYGHHTIHDTPSYPTAFGHCPPHRPHQPVSCLQELEEQEQELEAYWCRQESDRQSRRDTRVSVPRCGGIVGRAYLRKSNRDDSSTARSNGDTPPGC